MTKKSLKQLGHNVKEKAIVPIVDLILGRTISRKLMVFLIATVFVALKHITPVEWVDIAKVYIISQAGVDLGGNIVGKYIDKAKQKFNNKEAR